MKLGITWETSLTVRPSGDPMLVAGVRNNEYLVADDERGLAVFAFADCAQNARADGARQLRDIIHSLKETAR